MSIAAAVGEPARRVELLGAMLRWRRAQLARADVGLPPRPGARGGLTQEDVAELTGYAVRVIGQLEHGRLRSPSPQLLDAVAAGLRMSADERRTLWLLAASAVPSSSTYAVGTDGGLARMVQQLYPHPAYVTDALWNVQDFNPAVNEWFVDFGSMPVEDRNIAKWIFGNEHSQHVFVDWERDFAGVMIARMLAVAARVPDDPKLGALVDDLCGLSDHFRQAWGRAGNVYVDLPTETRYFRRPGHTDPSQADDVEHHVAIDMVILSPMRPDDDRRLVAFLLPPGEPHRPDVLSEQACAACTR